MQSAVETKFVVLVIKRARKYDTVEKGQSHDYWKRSSKMFGTHSKQRS